MMLSNSVRALVSGGVCLAILTTMLVLHAWPLMTGAPVYLRVRHVHNPTDAFRGDYVMLDYDINYLRIAEATPQGTGVPPPTNGLPDHAIDVRGLGDWWRVPAPNRRMTRRRVYVQLQPSPSSVVGVPGVHVPISVSDSPVPGAINIAGRIRFFNDGGRLQIDYGIDALYVSEGAGERHEIERAGVPLIAEVAVTSDGRARVRRVLTGQ